MKPSSILYSLNVGSFTVEFLPDCDFWSSWM